MEMISLKLDKGLLDHIDKTLKKNNFSTRTEFIREAIREKLAHMTQEELFAEFLKLRGKGKSRVSDEEYERQREKIVADYARRKGWL
ncbi:MAG: ribbon-helix-helix domain-containing protein [Nanoarchaeota archaeon]